MRYLTFVAGVLLCLGGVAQASRAANKPRDGKAETAKTIWTNDEIEKLRLRGLITFFSVPEKAPEAAAPASAAPYDETKDPAWYADEAAKLRAELTRAQAELREYRKALDDARNLKRTTGGLALDQDTIGITPEAGMEILERRVRDVAGRIDALEELARRNRFEPGLTRG